jgi:type I restriction enzyme M protein
MTAQEIVAKLWNLCHVLRDDSITYHEYVTELTFLGNVSNVLFSYS